MQKPRIGIPLCLDDRERWRPGRDYLYVDRRYADAITQAGGRPVHLPIQPDAAGLMTELDGLLLPGGDDFPSERPLPDGVELDLVAEAQLDFDTALVRAARALRRPILGICYGMQLLARTADARLEPHLPSGRPDAAPHRLPETQTHRIDVAAESRLGAAIGTGAKIVNSLHHQAVLEVGRTHRVVARSPDGVIEAIEAVDDEAARWEIGVQWHPEKREDETSQALFLAFVDAARRRSGERA